MLKTTFDERNRVLRSIDRVRSRAGQVHRQLLELYDSAVFDPRLPGVEERAEAIEQETRSLTGDVEDLRDELAGLRVGGADGRSARSTE